MDYPRRRSPRARGGGRCGFGFAALTLLVLACDGSGTPTGQDSARDIDDGAHCRDRPVAMAVAASLRDVAIDLADEFERDPSGADIVLSFGASSTLARQIEFGAPIDLVAIAGEEILAALTRDGFVAPETVSEIARGQLVLAAQPGSPFEALGIDAIESAALQRLGLPSAAVPLGRYGRAWLASLGLLTGLEGKIVITEDARANLTALDQGHVDLAILYETDRRLRPHLRALQRPATDSHPPIRYQIGRATSAPSCPAIDRVLQAWRSDASRARLEAAGFEASPRSTAASASASASAGAKPRARARAATMDLAATGAG